MAVQMCTCSMLWLNTVCFSFFLKLLSYVQKISYYFVNNFGMYLLNYPIIVKDYHISQLVY